MVNQEIVWAAGYFDGDGSVGFYRCGYVTVATAHRESVRRFARLWGGRVVEQRRAVGSFAKKRVWRWRIGGRAALAFAHAILPYSVEKKRQLELFVQIPYGTFQQANSLTADERARRAYIGRELRRLKR